MAKRVGTSYPGVFTVEKSCIGSTTRTEKMYYIRYRVGGNGKMVEERVGRESEGWTPARVNQERALRVSGKELSNQAKRDAAEAARKAEEDRPTIEKLWRQYDENNADRKIRRTDTGVFQNHLAEPFAEKTPDDLVTLDIDRIRINKLKTLSPQSVKHIISLLKRIITFGVKKGLCPQPDASRLHFIFPKVDNEKTENLSREQMAAYLAALDAEPDQNLAAFVRLALTTGMRKGALMALQWQDVDFELGFITLRGESAKSGKTQRIPMSSAARAVLEKIERSDSPFVFPGKGGKQRVEFEHMPQRIRDRAGLPRNFRPLHGLRHTFASWMASSGAVDLYTLQKLLTHASPQMTQRYAHLADEALQRAASVAGDIFKGVSGDTGQKAEVIRLPGVSEQSA
jgi:integrase